MNQTEFRLLNEFQRDFPLVSAPFQIIAGKLDVEEAWVLATLRRLLSDGSISRIGAVFRPGSIGAGTLAAMAVPRQALFEVAKRVGRHAGVNHNYEREHRLNLWFVANAPEESQLAALISAIEREAGFKVLTFPLEQEYHIDLGFDLVRSQKRAQSLLPSNDSVPKDRMVQRLVAVLQDGLSPVSRPFGKVAAACGQTETRVIEAIGAWQRSGVIRRFGIVVRHRELGFRANAMAVWDVPDDEVDAVGERLARAPDVHLCYRRTRRCPDWPFNLYCMVHGREREAVLDRVEQLSSLHGLACLPQEVLFSRRRFKQTGPRYFESAEIESG